MIRNLQNVDDDIAVKKRIIETMLYSDPDIIEVLDNDDIDAECPEEIMYQSLFPFIRIPGTQDVSKNYITFMVDDMEQASRNDMLKKQYVKFVVFVHKDLVQTSWGIARHDLLAYLIKDIFHLSNKFGMQMTLISNREGVTDTNYYTRTLQFEILTPNSIKPNNINPYEAKSILGRKDRVVQREPI